MSPSYASFTPVWKNILVDDGKSKPWWITNFVSTEAEFGTPTI